MHATQIRAVAREKPPAQPDFAAIKAKQQATWASGDFAVIGTTLQIVGESLAEAVDVRAGERVLDVAAGNGNATLAAARRFAQVTSTDYVPALLEKGAARAEAEGLDVAFQVADAEELPFADASFDVVLSTFGAMFTPDHTRPAREMLRVLRDGGRIGLANWTPEGFIGQLFKVSAPTSPACRTQVAGAVGNRAAHRRALRPTGRRHPLRAQAFQFPLSLERALDSGLPRFLWTDAQGVRRARCRQAGRTGARHHRPAGTPQRRGQVFAGRARRISGGRDRQRVTGLHETNETKPAAR